MPLYDAFGSTIEIVLLGNPQIVSNYGYDPYGVMKVNSGYRSPFPFLFHGLEQEYYDSQKLYWEPNGNVYNPDPFQLSLSGPQGLGGGGGAFPRAVRGPGSNPQVNIGADIYNVVINIINAFGGVNIGGSEGSNFPLDPYLNPFNWFSGGKPEIPWYDITHTSRRRHDIYPELGISHVISQKPSARGPHVPLAPLGESVDENIRIAKRHYGDLIWFFFTVHNHGPWDYKQREVSINILVISTMEQPAVLSVFLGGCCCEPLARRR